MAGMLLLRRRRLDAGPVTSIQQWHTLYACCGCGDAFACLPACLPFHRTHPSLTRSQMIIATNKRKNNATTNNQTHHPPNLSSPLLTISSILPIALPNLL